MTTPLSFANLKAGIDMWALDSLIQDSWIFLARLFTVN
jgi:hypothetical protein